MRGGERGEVREEAREEKKEETQNPTLAVFVSPADACWKPTDIVSLPWGQSITIGIAYYCIGRIRLKYEKGYL